MKKHTYYLLSEACSRLGIEESFMMHCIQSEWILPADPKGTQFDHEDLARMELILELKEDFGVNDEAMSIILHLLDELYAIRSQMKEFRNDKFRPLH